MQVHERAEVGEQLLAVLRQQILQAGRVGRDADDEAVAHILARHASVAVAAARKQESMAQAVDARKLVGQAKLRRTRRGEATATRPIPTVVPELAQLAADQAGSHGWPGARPIARLPTRQMIGRLRRSHREFGDHRFQLSGVVAEGVLSRSQSPIDREHSHIGKDEKDYYQPLDPGRGSSMFEPLGLPVGLIVDALRRRCHSGIEAHWTTSETLRRVARFHTRQTAAAKHS